MFAIGERKFSFSKALRRHEQATFVFEPAVDQKLADVLLDLARVGASAVQRLGDFDVGVLVAIAADRVHDVECAEHLGLLGEAEPDDVNDFALFVVAFELVAFPGERVHVAVVKDGAGFIIVFFQLAFDFFDFVALGVFALLVGHVPTDFVGEERFEGYVHARVEILHGLAEDHVGVTGQVCLAFLGAAAVEAKVRAGQERVLGDECHDVVPEDVPKGVHRLVVGVFARGGLGDGDEVVDLGGGGLGGVVLHEQAPLGR